MKYTDDPSKPLDDWETVEPEDGDTSVVTPPLSPDTPYTFVVQAVDDDGPGKLSPPEEITTKQPGDPSDPDDSEPTDSTEDSSKPTDSSEDSSKPKDSSEIVDPESTVE